MPKTKLGKSSFFLIVAVPFLFVLGTLSLDLFYESITSGQTILEDIAKRPALAIPMLTGMLAGIAAFGTGLIALIKHKERSILVFISTVLGALMLLFVIAEIAFPH